MVYKKVNKRAISTPTGSIYVLTLVSVVVMIALLLGMAQRLSSARSQQRVSSDSRGAHVLAEMGIRQAIRSTMLAETWRSLLPDGIWLNNITAGSGSYTVWVEDPDDGVIGNDIGTPVKMIGQGTLHGVNRSLSVLLEQQPLPILDFALAAHYIEMYDYSVIEGAVTSNNYLYKQYTPTITGNAEAYDWIGYEYNISGTVNESTGKLKLMPYDDTIRTYYKDRAVKINYYAIPYRIIDERVLSYKTNPWGAVQSDGLYYIDCKGGNLTIRDSRVYGTLILDNLSEVVVENSVRIQPYRLDYPGLVVFGRLRDNTETNVDEDDQNMDLSLPGESGYGSQYNVWANGYRGLVYVSGDAIMRGKSYVKGVMVVGGLIQMGQYAKLVYDSSVKDNKPRGFEEFYLTPQARTWRDIIAPENN